MELYHLRHFKIVAKYENMTKAAEELFISQPALSISIMKLEESIGKKLFDRDGRKIKLNDVGRLLLDYVERIDAELELVLDAIRNIDNKKKPITVAITSSGYMRDIIQHFRILNGIQVKIIIDNSQNITKQLLSGKIDFAITLPQIHNVKITSLLLLEQCFYIVVPNTNELYNKIVLSFDDLKKATFWGLPLDDPYRIYIDGLLAEKNIYLNYTIENHNLLIRNIATYNHLAIIHHPTSKLAKNYNLSYKRIEGLTERHSISLQYIAENLSNSGFEFINFMKNKYYPLLKKALDVCETL